ncbi:MAG: methylamine utilization protein [Rubrivivax sp.]|nr:methylamine utilization protein [Rubrivivax sp.]
MARTWAGALALGWAAVGAAPVEVRVTAAGGKALDNAVVFLEPLDGKSARAAAAAPPAEIAQVDKRFVPDVTVVPVGTAVSFPNRDTVRHHVYSFSPVKRFEIKLYVGTPANPVVFDQPGIAVLGCNIHDTMAAWVVVVDTPWYGRTGAGGRLLLPSVPAGRYRLRAWHATMPVGSTPIERPLRVETAQLAVAVELAEAAP